MSFIVTAGKDNVTKKRDLTLEHTRDVLILKSAATVSLPRKRVGREGQPPDDGHDVHEIQAKTVGRKTQGDETEHSLGPHTNGFERPRKLTTLNTHPEIYVCS